MSPRFRIVLLVAVEADADRFHAWTPALPGLHADGDTAEAAVEDVLAHVPAYLESLTKHQEPWPIGPSLDVIRHPEAPIPPEATLLERTLEWPASPLMSGAS